MIDGVTQVCYLGFRIVELIIKFIVGCQQGFHSDGLIRGVLLIHYQEKKFILSTVGAILLSLLLVSSSVLMTIEIFLRESREVTDLATFRFEFRLEAVTTS